MMRLRPLGQTPQSEPLDWRGAWAAGAFIALAYFFLKAPATPEWARRQ